VPVPADPIGLPYIQRRPIEIGGLTKHARMHENRRFARNAVPLPLPLSLLRA